MRILIRIMHFCLDEDWTGLPVRLLSVDEDLEAGRMPRELEQPHDANDAKEL